jgi:rhamnose transport system substrate-binding protein
MKNRTIRTIVFCPLFFAVALVLAGCQRQETATAPANVDASGPVNKRITVVYIPKNSGNPYFNSIVTKMREACNELGVTFVDTAPATPEATSQIPFLKDQIQRGVSAICISPNSPDALNTVFDDARAKGIKIIVVNSDIPGSETHRDAAILPTDFDKLGAEQVELLGSLIGYKGKFAILSATTDAPDQNYWIAGMKEALKQEKYAGMELVSVVYGDDRPEKSRIEAESLLSKHPDLRAILAPTAVGVEQAAKTVEAAGVYPGGPKAKGDGVVVTGLGTPNQMRRHIKDGIIPAVALWSPPDEGLIAAHLAVGLVRGTIKAENGQSFDVPGLGQRTFKANGVIVTGPPLVFTKDNIDQYQF